MKSLIAINVVATLLMSTNAAAQDVEHISQDMRPALCSLKLNQMVYDVIEDKTVKIAKHGDNLMMDSPKASVHAWCADGQLKVSIDRKDRQK